MKKLNNKKNIYINRLKERYLYIILLTILMVFFSYFYKQDVFINLVKGSETKEKKILSGEVNEYIIINKDNPRQISLNVGTNKECNESAIYKINILKDNNIIASEEIDTLELSKNQNIVVSLPSKEILKGDKIILQIKTDNLNQDNALILHLSENNDTLLNINGIETKETLNAQIIYGRFSTKYVLIFIFIYLISCLAILGWNSRFIHNYVFIIIMSMGIISAVINPIMDIPDEPAHLARAELTSRGILFANGDPMNFNISQSVSSLIDNTFLTIEDGNFVTTEGNYKYTEYYNNYASSNIFISYIPQAIGIILGKLLGGSIAILLLGRICNLMCYALMIRYALKISPRYKIGLSIIAMMPMVIFIAASFNQDASTYGLTLLAIAYFLKIYDKDTINIKNIAIFSSITILLGLIKLPYCILAALIIFIPKEKFKDNKTYYKSFIFVGCVAIITVLWGLSSLLINSNTGSTTVTPFSIYYAENNVSAKGQIQYILSSPKEFLINFIRSLFDNIRLYLDQMNTLGWLSYSINSTVTIIYQVFLFITLFMYSEKNTLKAKTRLGSALILLGIYVATNLILYLSWTSVGSNTIVGVQGRYFCSALALIPLMSSNEFSIKNTEKKDFKLQFLALVFIVIFIITIMNRYY